MRQRHSFICIRCPEAVLAILGRCSEAYEALIAGIELARKNDNGPWLDILTGILGSVHLQLSDFGGARDLACERLGRRYGELRVPTQMHLVLVRGQAELALGRTREALEDLSAVRAYDAHDRPVLHWYERMQARLGIAEASLAAGDLTMARDEASELVAAVSALEESGIKALASEFNARVALAMSALHDADAHIQQAAQSMPARSCDRRSHPPDDCPGGGAC